MADGNGYLGYAAKGDGYDDQRQALADNGYSTPGLDPDSGCEVWEKYDESGNRSVRYICPPKETSPQQENTDNPPGFTGDNYNNNPYGYGTQNYNPFNNPGGTQNAGGTQSPGVPAWVAPAATPTPDGFYNPVVSKVAALGGGPDAMPVFSPGAQQPVNTPSASTNAPNEDSPDLDVCCDIVFYCSGSGPMYQGKLVFSDRGNGATLASCDAISGCNDPVHYGTPYGYVFNISSFSSPSLGNTRVYEQGVISFKAGLTPSTTTDPQTGNDAGPFFIFPMGDNSNCTKGAIGVKGEYDEMKKVQRLLKANAKCKSPVFIGVPPQRDTNAQDGSDSQSGNSGGDNNSGDNGSSNYGGAKDTTDKSAVLQPLPLVPLVPLPANPPAPQPMQQVPIPTNPVTNKSVATASKKTVTYKWDGGNSPKDAAPTSVGTYGVTPTSNEKTKNQGNNNASSKKTNVDYAGYTVSSNELRQRLYQFSQYLGKDITITSGNRLPEKNKEVGGAKDSRHIHGDAADVKIDGEDNEEIAKQAYQSNLFNTVIYYPNFNIPGALRPHVHVDMNPNHSHLFLEYKPILAGGKIHHTYVPYRRH